MEVKHIPAEMTSSSQVVEALIKRGMGKEFILDGAGVTLDNKRSYHPDELRIIKVFEFKGVSNPSHIDSLYLIRAADGVIGYVKDDYGDSADHEVTDMINNFVRLIPKAGEEEMRDFEL